MYQLLKMCTFVTISFLPLNEFDREFCLYNYVFVFFSQKTPEDPAPRNSYLSLIGILPPFPNSVILGDSLHLSESQFNL